MNDDELKRALALFRESGHAWSKHWMNRQPVPAQLKRVPHYRLPIVLAASVAVAVLLLAGGSMKTSHRDSRLTDESVCPTLPIKGLGNEWGRRFRLPTDFSTDPDACGSDQSRDREGAVFVPIPFVAPPAPYERIAITRMDVPVAALIAAGFNIPSADPAGSVRADVLMGQDGRVHAVRLLGRNSN